MDKLECALENLQLALLNAEEQRLERLKLDCVQRIDWAQRCLCLEQLVSVRSQKKSLERKLDPHQEMLRYQQRLQEIYRDSKLVFVHEYNPDVIPVRIRFEIISKHVDSQIQNTPLVSSHDNIQESNNEVVVDEPCGEIVKDLDEVIETSCVEMAHDLKEVVETSCDEQVATRQEILLVANFHASFEDDSQIEPTKKHEFVKIVDFVEYVHDSRFVGFHPTKIRGRNFSKKGIMKQLVRSLGNTSKLIFLVNLFTIWVGFIIEICTGAFIHRCWVNMGNIISWS
jgi:hypothetical protein